MATDEGTFDKNLSKFLNSFGKQVVNRAKAGIGRKKRDGKTRLAQSIKFNVIQKGLDFTVEFSMLDYGTYVDKGVSGTKVKRTFVNYRGKRINTPYSYRPTAGHSQPPSSALDKWVVRKGIAPRDEKGRFMSRKTITFLIARSIGFKGIQGIAFFQKPLKLGLKEFGPKILKIIKQDIVNTFETKTGAEVGTNTTTK